jgi:predicted nucleic acid-binding protein
MKKKLFLDTNIILDLLNERPENYEHAAKLMVLCDQEVLDIYASSLSFATTYYFLSKFENKVAALIKLRKFKLLCSVSTVDEKGIEKSLASNFPDFEDAIQYYSALSQGCDFIITRNKKDFKLSDIPVLTASEFLAQI